MTQLYDKLQYVSSLREHRSKLSNEILANKTLYPELIEVCFLVDDKVSIKAMWILEFISNDKLEWLLPYIDKFIINLDKVKFDSAKRPMAKICEVICSSYFGKTPSIIKEKLNDNHLQKIAEACFDWLINDEKVAVKAYSMSSLFLLGQKLEWVHPELKQILEQGFSEHTAAYKARARHILNKLK